MNVGTLGGNGSVSGPVTLAFAAQIAPGDPAIKGGVGTLSIGPLTWTSGATMVFQLGATPAASDQLVIGGALGKSGAGNFRFHFGMGDRPPVNGQTYTLIQSTNASAFTASDFTGNFDFDNTYVALTGIFSINSNAVQFTLTSVQSDRIFANSFD